MNTLIATALVPVFLVISAGYFAGKSKLLDNQNVVSLNCMLMQFALPLSLFVSIARTSQSLIMQNCTLALVFAIGMLLTYAIEYVVQRQYYKLSLGEAATESLTVSFPNFASIGLPLLLPLFGHQGALPIAIAIAVGSVTISPLTLALLEIHSSGLRANGATASVSRLFVTALGHSIRKPIFLGPVLGLTFSLSGLKIPPLVVVSVGPLTSSTAGLGLFMTGIMLSAQPIRVTKDVVFSTVIKNIIQPVIVYCFVRLFDVPIDVASEAVLLSAIPSGFFGLVFGAESRLNPQLTGSTLLISTLSSIATLSIAIFWLVPHQY